MSEVPGFFLSSQHVRSIVWRVLRIYIIIIMSNKCLIIAFFVSQEGQISYHRKDTLNFLDKSGWPGCIEINCIIKNYTYTNE